MKEIIIDPITRLEGHGNVSMHSKGGVKPAQNPLKASAALPVSNW